METPGESIKQIIKPKESNICPNKECIFCKNNIPCTSKHNIYKFTCNHCSKEENGGKEQFYIGATRRVISKRFKEHEASTRRYTNATSLGIHMIEKHPELKPRNIPRKGKVNFENLFKRFTQVA